MIATTGSIGARTRRRAPVVAELPTSQPLNGLLLLAMVLLALGLVVMTSASVDFANTKYGDPFYFFKRQAVFSCLGLLAGIATLSCPMSFWRRYSGLLLLLSIALLVIVLIPGIGIERNGSQRWLPMGLFNLQPSELAKVFVVIYLAAYLERHLGYVQDRWLGFLKPVMILAVIAGLLYLEPDHGSLVIIMLTGFCLVFLAGVKLHRFVLMLLPCVAGVYYAATKMPHVLDRFSSFLDPWSPENVYGDGYQLAQALIAFGRGEWAGLGLGNSIQKLYFLPEAHTDFVLAIIGEEFGMIGVLIVVGLFCVLVIKAFAVARSAQASGQLFNAFVAYGLALVLAGQTLINIGVNIALLPTKGLTLPFLSYGGASLIVSCVMVAMLVRIEYETGLPQALTTRNVQDKRRRT